MTFLGGFRFPKMDTAGETHLESKVPEWTKEDEDNLKRRVRCVAPVGDFQWCRKHNASWKIMEEWCDGAAK